MVQASNKLVFMQAADNKIRHLVLVFGDQLDDEAAVFDDFEPQRDAVLMMEVTEEATYIPQHKIRLVLFFAAMRHFAQALRQQGITVLYSQLDDSDNRGSFDEEIKRYARKSQPQKIVCTQPGDYRVLEKIRRVAAELNCPLDLRGDRHFMVTIDAFQEFAQGRKSLRLENFYREVRRKHDVLMHDGKPAAGKWNFDAENREAMTAEALDELKAPRSFPPDEITIEVIRMVEERFKSAPGSLHNFDYAVTREQAKLALEDFITHRLPHFGAYQDAMFKGQPYLFHSRLSCVLNLHLLKPRETIEAAVVAYERGHAPINSVEGFVRQIIGWREYVRGIYWTRMPEYANMNYFAADLPMPAFMWTAETDMNCVRECIAQLQNHAYAHHIQRLMVLGLFSLLLGVHPYEVHRWHMSLYADAIDWVSLPNVLGMSQYADGGIMATKPYCASGNYIRRMSNYCNDCRFDPKKAAGDNACPFTTLYWDFLSRNRNRLQNNPRMRMQFRNLDRKSASDLQQIQKAAGELKDRTL